MGEEEEARGEEGSPHQEGLKAVGQDEADKSTKEANPRFKSKSHAGPGPEKGRVPCQAQDWHCEVAQEGLKLFNGKRA